MLLLFNLKRHNLCGKWRTECGQENLWQCSVSDTSSVPPLIFLIPLLSIALVYLFHRPPPIHTSATAEVTNIVSRHASPAQHNLTSFFRTMALVSHPEHSRCRWSMRLSHNLKMRGSWNPWKNSFKYWDWKPVNTIFTTLPSNQLSWDSVVHKASHKSIEAG